MKAMMKARVSGGNYLRHRNILIHVDHVSEDKRFGAALIGTSVFTGKPIIVFQNPVASDARRNAKRVNTINDWVKGINAGGRQFSLGKGSYALVSDNTRRQDAPPRETTINGKKVTAEVVFTQWTQNWRSTEVINHKYQDTNPKDVFFGYAITRMYRGKETGQENVRLDFFAPEGQGDPFALENGTNPVINRFTSLGELKSFVRQNSSRFGSYMCRIVDRESGKIVGQGEFITARDWENPNTPAEVVFMTNLWRRLNLTDKGIAQLLAHKRFQFEMYGLQEAAVTRIAERGKSLSEQLLESSLFVPRDEEGEKQVSFLAIPCAIRGAHNDQGIFWVDKVVPIGKIGRDANGMFADDSDVISADAYSGNQERDEYGNPLERGLDREVFEVEGRMIDSMRSLARELGCEAMQQGNLPPSDIDNDRDMIREAEAAAMEEEYGGPTGMDDVPF